MEALKNAVGLGKTQQGEEPVSGQQGAGNVAEPYDQGNQVDDPTLGGKAPQQTSASNDFAESAPTSTSTPPTNATATDTTASSGKPNILDSTTSTSSGIEAVPEQKTDQSAKTGGIGSSSWFKTALPFGKGKPAAEDAPIQDVSRDAEPDQKPTVSEPEIDIKDLPPNHLPSSVPDGQSTDFAPPVAPTGITDAPTSTIDAPTSATDLPKAESDTGDVAAVSGSDSMASPTTDQSTTTGPRSSELPGTHASIASPPADLSNAPLRPANKAEPHGDNHGSIPTAGGQVIGQAAMEQRRASVETRGASHEPTSTAPEPTASTPATTSTSTPVPTTSEPEPEPATTKASDADVIATPADDHEIGAKEKKSHNPLHKLKEKLHHKH